MPNASKRYAPKPSTQWSIRMLVQSRKLWTRAGACGKLRILWIEWKMYGWNEMLKLFLPIKYGSSRPFPLKPIHWYWWRWLGRLPAAFWEGPILLLARLAMTCLGQVTGGLISQQIWVLLPWWYQFIALTAAPSTLYPVPPCHLPKHGDPAIKIGGLEA